MPDKPFVFLCAHPDDMAAVAGTLLLLRQKGYAIHDFCLTRGEKGRTPPDGRDTATVRLEEEHAACELVGAELTCFGEPDGALFAGREICTTVADRLRQLRPAGLITHWPLEKPDHSAAFAVAFRALHLAELFFTTELYLANTDGRSCMFTPDLYVNVSEVIEPKLAVARCYRNQWETTAAEPAEQAARAHGKAAWCDCAEAFATPLPLMGTRWGRRAEVGRILLDL